MEKFAHELQPGDRYDPLEVRVSPELNQQILFAQEDFDPRYFDETEFGPPHVHPTLLLMFSANTKSPSFRLAPGTGSILAEATTEFFNPAHVNKKLHISWKITDTYEKRGRNYQVMEASMVDEDGMKILRRDLHLTFFEHEPK
ncbi:MAG TPA: hypothetical protein DDZ83_16920 [Nitrospinae bacterium]|nr:hypothetical protein [Nitrospinota bacterium]